jgi:hypothetical protein
MKARILLGLVALVALYGAYRHAPLEAALSAAGAAAITWALVTWRTLPIVSAARELADAFCFSNRPCIDEIRAVSRAVLLWRH